MIREDEHLVRDYKGMMNLKEIFQYHVEKNPDKLFLGSREKIINQDGTCAFGEYKFKTYQTTYDDSLSLARYLVKEGLCPVTATADGSFRFIGIFAKNREEWVLTDFAGILAGIASVTIFDTLTPEFIQHILNQTQIRTISLQSDKVKGILEMKQQGSLPYLQALLHYDPLEPSLLA
mmetsp:Transcript_49051/g.36116  ORF Transcript_49051/g.36116 Transcript_49051/m.36116 type:complete len:177 (-) Transcript_49051:1461-1991(-)